MNLKFTFCTSRGRVYETSDKYPFGLFHNVGSSKTTAKSSTTTVTTSANTTFPSPYATTTTTTLLKLRLIDSRMGPKTRAAQPLLQYLQQLFRRLLGNPMASLQRALGKVRYELALQGSHGRRRGDVMRGRYVEVRNVDGRRLEILLIQVVFVAAFIPIDFLSISFWLSVSGVSGGTHAVHACHSSSTARHNTPNLPQS